jgi:hypothetical protein
VREEGARWGNIVGRVRRSFWFGRKETSMETKCGPVEACLRASVSGRCLLSGLGNQGMGDASSEKNNIGHGIVQARGVEGDFMCVIFFEMNSDFILSRDNPIHPIFPPKPHVHTSVIY